MQQSESQENLIQHVAVSPISQQISQEEVIVDLKKSESVQSFTNESLHVSSEIKKSESIQSFTSNDVLASSRASIELLNNSALSPTTKLGNNEAFRDIAHTRGLLSAFGVKYNNFYPSTTILSQGSNSWNNWDNFGVKTPPNLKKYIETAKDIKVTSPQAADPHAAANDHKSLDELKVPGVRYPHILIRMLVLFLCFAGIIGPSMGYSAVGALSARIKSDYSIDDAQLGVLFSVYSFPNIVLVFIIGILLDYIGINAACFICCAFFVVGNALTIGDSYWFLLIGRIIYGIGSEGIGVVQSAVIARWFTFDRQISLSIATAIGNISYRASAFIMMFGIPPLAEATNLRLTLIVVNIVVITSAACWALLAIFGFIYSKYLHLHDAIPDAAANDAEKKIPFKQKLIASVKSFFRGLKLPIMYWVLTIGMLAYYAAILPLVSYINTFLIDTYGFTSSTASLVSSLIYGVATVFLLPTGLLIDRFGHRLSIIMFGYVLVIVAYILLLTEKVTPWISVSLLGLSYAIIPGAIWPTYAIIVDESKLGVAYGLANALLNGTLSVVPIILGYIPSYFYKNLTLMICAIVGAIISVLTLVMDRIFLKAKIEFTCVKRSRKGMTRNHWKFLKLLSKLRKHKEEQVGLAPSTSATELHESPKDDHHDSPPAAASEAK